MSASSNVPYPCGVCNKNCKGNSIACGICESWFHIRCENLKNEDFKFLQGTIGQLDYQCHRCCILPNAKFDYGSGIHRLSKSLSLGFLDQAVKLEKIFLRNEDNSPIIGRAISDTRGLRPDITSLRLLSKIGSKLPANQVPCYATGNGNCLIPFL